MSRSTGVNIQRRVISGVGINNITQDIRSIWQSGVAPFLYRAVVVEVYHDPFTLTEEQVKELEKKVANPELVSTMPPNSILARIVSNSQDLRDSTPYIFYPFFSSHLQLPVKPGEQVFVIFEDLYLGFAAGYWLTRIISSRWVEDPNYTHYDRIFDPTNNPRNYTTANRARGDGTNSIPNFINGAGTPETYTLQQENINENPFDNIVRDANASSVIIFEPVPRQRKKPADLAFYGSNNTAIILGIDKDIAEKAGTIDIVAGLGAPRRGLQPGQDPGANNPTAPRTIRNTRNKFETDKTPYKSNKNVNLLEGAPDFKRDLSRIYISMKTKGDKNFGINFGNDNGNSNGIFPNTQEKYGTKIKDLPANENEGQPFIIIKSEYVRIVGTGKDNENGPSESGDIRIIKEGKVGQAPFDFGAVILADDGRVMVQGKNVYININDPENGRIYLGCPNDESGEPIVIYSKLESTLRRILEHLQIFLQETARTYSSIMAVANSTNVSVPFAPNPAIAVMTTQFSSLAATLNNIVANINTTNSNIPQMRSKNVFVKRDFQL